MDRRSAPFCLSIVALVSLTLGASVGCRSIFQTAAYLFQGTNSPADYEGLKGKKVVVVCRTMGQEFRNAASAKVLAQQVSDLLKERVKDIQIIDPQKVADLNDRQEFDNYYKLGKELKADVVVAIELESFGVLEGPTLYRGRAMCDIKVYDVAEKKVAWKKPSLQVAYPTNEGIGLTERGSEIAFRNEFIGVLADKIGRSFYPYDKYDDFGRDAASM